MNFDDYIDLFHDGGLESISHEGDEIKLSIVSSEILPEWNKDNLKLDDCKRISGALICQKVTEIIINDIFYHEKLFISHDSGELLDFDINEDIVEMGINWTNYPPRKDIRDYWNLKIKSKKIIWVDSFNPILLDLTGSKMGIYRIRNHDN